MAGVKTNERPGTRAVLRHGRLSAYKARGALNLIRGKDVATARSLLALCERDAATVCGKVLDSAVANAENNDGQDRDELYVSACYADEGMTIKRWRPRARGRATSIRKRTCHITVIVSRMSEEQLLLARRRAESEAAMHRARRVAAAREQGRRTRRRERRGETELAAAEPELAGAEPAERALAGAEPAEPELDEDEVAEGEAEQVATDAAGQEGEQPTDRESEQ